MGAGAVYANFRYNGTLLGGTTRLGDPNVVGMDEDYDACDLENWFLAMQSADGQVIVPSFHRPGIINFYPPNGTDWGVMTPAARSKFLRPRQADGNDPNSFPDLLPDPTSGKITYDVDNDGDGLTDSVWVDLKATPRGIHAVSSSSPCSPSWLSASTAGSRSIPPGTWRDAQPRRELRVHAHLAPGKLPERG